MRSAAIARRCTSTALRTSPNPPCCLPARSASSDRALDDDALLDEALETLDNVAQRLSDANGLRYHVFAPSGTGKCAACSPIRRFARALVDAHEISGQARFSNAPEAICDAIIAKFETGDGGFYDRLQGSDDVGRLSRSDRPIVENGLFA